MPSLLDNDKLVIDAPELGCIVYVPGLPGGSNTLYERSPYCNIGTITGATWKRLESGLWYLSYDGTDDYVDFGAPPVFTINKYITLEAWIYLDAKTADYQTIMGRYDSAANGKIAYALWINTSDNLAFLISEDGILFDDATVSITTGAWHHVAGVYDGISVSVYLNGSPTSQATDISSIYSATCNFLIGAQHDTGGGHRRYFGGDVALARVYNFPCSSLQIQEHFQREKHLFGVW